VLSNPFDTRLNHSILTIFLSEKMEKVFSVGGKENVYRNVTIIISMKCNPPKRETNHLIFIISLFKLTMRVEFSRKD